METTTIQHKVYIPASPDQVYEVMMHANRHANLTSDDAVIEDKEGSFFSFFSGYITGTNIRLIKHELIVQLWNAKEEGWPEDHYSKVTFKLIKEEAGTCIEFTQEEIPHILATEIARGWYDYYWNPMVDLFTEEV